MRDGGASRGVGLQQVVAERIGDASGVVAVLVALAPRPEAPAGRDELRGHRPSATKKNGGRVRRRGSLRRLCLSPVWAVHG